MKKSLLFFKVFLMGLSVTAQRTGNDYAVFFYVTDFKPGWAPLPETKKEALAIKNELENNFDFICEEVWNPSKQQMRDTIRAYNDRLGLDDQVLFYFSMHGDYNESSDRGYLIGFDGNEEDQYQDSWLSYDDLRTDLAVCSAKHILLALDACHSGSFGIRNRPKPEVPAYKKTDDCFERITKMFKYQGRQYCTSGNKDARTPAESLFAIRFLEALRKGGEQGIIRFDDLEYFLGKVDNPRPESGTFKGHEASGDFVFVRKGGCVASSDKSNTDENAENVIWKIAQKQLNGHIYLDEYPNGKFGIQAHEIIAWKEAVTANSCSAYQKYKSEQCPSGAHCKEAHEMVVTLGCELKFRKSFPGSSDLPSDECLYYVRALSESSSTVIAYENERVPAVSSLAKGVLQMLQEVPREKNLYEILGSLQKVSDPIGCWPLDAGEMSKGFVLYSKKDCKTISDAKNYAIFFDCMQYQNTHWASLPANGLDKIAAELEDNYNFSSKTLTNPTMQVIKEELHTLSEKKYGEKDQLLVYFSGQGASGDLSKYYFIPVDGGYEKEAFDLSAIDLSNLNDLLRNIPVKHLVVVMDSSYGKHLKGEGGK